MSHLTLDNQALAQLELSTYLAQQSSDTAHYEIDSTDDIFGKLYRVWGGQLGINCFGTFYQNLDGFWVSQPCCIDERQQWRTSDEAVAAIVNA
ncbi:hypothetical protein DP113_34705 (plasmid) [Brasilonema octagenarum UFV-E1]|uniref:Uncharacterized protein n=2 Tax=Brasilonema TaxID=383614 RepID=A0A856MN43_9CYAN|nr:MULTISPECIES: hypothetical protein [Brasilonema]NMF66923.1 hypothetical protein [Brasilonema octagenarum UFV-OR1]QDL12855.1 hypothetical protein DP114_34600 [Brasilonema sennae CENA114]QDL19251.1 hypothetical protein DP113_34705 [Brasilonema octagenarum UFV-E1]